MSDSKGLTEAKNAVAAAAKQVAKATEAGDLEKAQNWLSIQNQEQAHVDRLSD